MDRNAKIEALTNLGLSCGSGCTCVQELADKVDPSVIDTLESIASTTALARMVDATLDAEIMGTPRGSRSDPNEAIAAVMLMSLLGVGDRTRTRWPGGRDPFGQ